MGPFERLGERLSAATPPAASAEVAFFFSGGYDHTVPPIGDSQLGDLLRRGVKVWNAKIWTCVAPTFPTQGCGVVTSAEATFLMQSTARPICRVPNYSMFEHLLGYPWARKPVEFVAGLLPRSLPLALDWVNSNREVV